MDEKGTETDLNEGPQAQLTQPSWLRRMMNVFQIIRGNAVLKMMDVLGQTRLSIRNSNGVEVAAITSLGDLYLSHIIATHDVPGVLFQRDGAAANSGIWDYRAYIDSGVEHFALRLINDALNAATSAIDITRSGITITGFTLGGSVAVTGTITPSLGAVLPRSDSSAVFGIDATSAGVSIVLANDAAAYIGAASPTNNFAGWIFIHETTSDLSGAIFYIGNGASYLVSDPVAHYAATSTASKSCVFLSADTPVILNKRGGSRTYNVLTIRAGTAH